MPEPIFSTNYSAFLPAASKGGSDLDAKKTAIVLIEFQNEFATEGGKLHEAVKPVMEITGMLAKAEKTAAVMREVGGMVVHMAIKFKEDSSDNPNKGLGILGGCNDGKLFTANTWNSEFCASMKPLEGDVVLDSKRGLDSFPHTTLEAELKEKGITTVVVCGFLTNCCVESTMRTAYEKGFNVVTLTDCCAATSIKGHEAAAGPEGTFGMFSKMMTAADFQEAVKGA